MIGCDSWGEMVMGGDGDGMREQETVEMEGKCG